MSLVNSLSDDEIKMVLKAIEDKIIEYDICIYSPTVESGVNINIPGYFGNLCILYFSWFNIGKSVSTDDREN